MTDSTAATRLPTALVIVDDEADHAEIIRQLTAEIAPDLHVRVVQELSQLSRGLRRAPPGALLLIDRVVHGRETIELLPALRALRPDMTAVMLSAALSDRDRQRALAAGAHRAVQKPGRIADWRELLDDLLRLSGERHHATAPSRAG